MAAMEKRQRGASLEGNEIVELLDRLDAALAGKFKTAREWSQIFQRRLTASVTEHTNHELLQKVCRTGWVAYQFSANEQVLTERFGMEKKRGTPAPKDVLCYRFTRLRATEKANPPELDPEDV